MSSAWPALAQGISALAKGDGTILLLLADLYLDRRADGSYGNAIEAFDVISCVDEQRTTDPAAIADGARRELAAAPYRDSRARGRERPRQVRVLAGPADQHPAHPERDGPRPDGGGLDDGRPGDALRGGVDLAKALGGTLLRVEGEQHGAVLAGSSCVDDAVSAYLVDLTVPAAGTACRLDT